MGILLVDKNADFSGVAIGNAGLYTSVTDDLLALFELRSSVSKARQNSAPVASAASALLAGGIVYAPTHLTLNAVGQATFPTSPKNGGENSLAIIVKVLATTGGIVIGSYPTSHNNDGTLNLNMSGRVMTVATYTSGSQSSMVSRASLNTQMAMPVDGSLDGTFQMFVSTMKSQDSVKLYHPASGAVITSALTSSQFLYFNEAAAGVQFKGLASGTAAQDVSLFAHWDRVLTEQEVQTFYAEMKKQYGRIGLAI